MRKYTSAEYCLHVPDATRIGRNIAEMRPFTHCASLCAQLCPRCTQIVGGPLPVLVRFERIHQIDDLYPEFRTFAREIAQMPLKQRLVIARVTLNGGYRETTL